MTPLATDLGLYRPARWPAYVLASAAAMEEFPAGSCPQENVETICASISDHLAFQRFNREPCAG
jgi:hypothetical protein